MTEPLAKYPSERLVKIKQADPAKDSGVPNLYDWSQWSDRNIANRQSFSHTTKHGEYFIEPVGDKSGRHVGYHLSFAHTGEKMSDKEGMTDDLGLFNNAGKAVAAAKKHHLSAGSKTNIKERISECMMNRKKKHKKEKKENKFALRDVYGYDTGVDPNSLMGKIETVLSARKK